MHGNSSPRASAVSRPPLAKRRRCLVAALITATAFATTMQCAAAPPAAGDTFVYRVINGYNNETDRQVGYRVESSDAGRVVVAATTQRNGMHSTATEIHTPDGKWLRRALSSHGRPLDYEFSPAGPAYDFPLDPGKQWSTRVNAVNPATGARRSVRIDATVRGSERIRVPAGEFDVVRIIRSIYAGDADFPLTETNIVETEWYAPSLGRSVRLVTRSDWRNLAMKGAKDMRGDWDIYELVSVSAPPAR